MLPEQVDEAGWTATSSQDGVTLSSETALYSVGFDASGPIRLMADLPPDRMWMISWLEDGTTTVRFLRGEESAANWIIDPDGTLSNLGDSQAMAQQMMPKLDERLQEIQADLPAAGDAAGTDWAAVARRVATIATAAVPAIVTAAKQDKPKPAACRKCGAELRPGVKFCVKCGEPALKERKCAKCGSLLEPGDSFCGGCGAKTE
jgi:hypothetical protein